MAGPGGRERLQSKKEQKERRDRSLEQREARKQRDKKRQADAEKHLKQIENRDRRNFEKEVREYYNDQATRWGMKKVKLVFTHDKDSAFAGGYTGSGKKGENKGTVIINIPQTTAWSNRFRSEGRGTNPVTEGKRIVRYEMAHHRQRLKEDAGKSTDKTGNLGIHGPQYDKQVKQHAGGVGSRKPPKTLRKPRKNSREASAGGGRRVKQRKPKPGPVRTGPPRNKPIKRRKNQRNIRYTA